jgi:hypothetical protein
MWARTVSAICAFCGLSGRPDLGLVLASGSCWFSGMHDSGYVKICASISYEYSAMHDSANVTHACGLINILRGDLSKCSSDDTSLSTSCEYSTMHDSGNVTLRPSTAVGTA